MIRITYLSGRTSTDTTRSVKFRAEAIRGHKHAKEGVEKCLQILSEPATMAHEICFVIGGHRVCIPLYYILDKWWWWHRPGPNPPDPPDPYDLAKLKEHLRSNPFLRADGLAPEVLVEIVGLAAISRLASNMPHSRGFIQSALQQAARELRLPSHMAVEIDKGILSRTESES